MTHILLLKTRQPGFPLMENGAAAVASVQFTPSEEDQTSFKELDWPNPAITHIWLLKFKRPWLLLPGKAAEAVALVQDEPFVEFQTSFNRFVLS
jgi:hypothetical protein